MRSHAADLAPEARTDHVVGVACEDRRDEALQFLGCVFAVGVTERHRVHIPVGRFAQAGPNRGAEAQRRLAHDDRSRGRRDLRRGVGGTVVDDHRHDVVTGDAAGEAREHGTDGRGLVASRKERNHGPGAHVG